MSMANKLANLTRHRNDSGLRILKSSGQRVFLLPPMRGASKAPRGYADVVRFHGFQTKAGNRGQVIRVRADNLLRAH